MCLALGWDVGIGQIGGQKVIVFTHFVIGGDLDLENEKKISKG